MKTPAEWLKEIKHLSDTEIRHGSSVFLLKEDIRRIQEEAFKYGYEQSSIDSVEVP